MSMLLQRGCGNHRMGSGVEFCEPSEASLRCESKGTLKSVVASEANSHFPGATQMSPSVQGLCSWSVAKSCLTPCDPMDGSMPGFPVLHCLPEFVQTHVP